MNMNDLVDELLSQWEEHYERGERISAEELCQHHPELLAEVRSQIAALMAIDANFGGMLGNPQPVDSAEIHAQRLGRPLQVTSEFKLLELHASGGLGDVYLAQDPVIQRQVAVKFPRQSRLTPTQLARFEREARITGQLDHPGIVAVHSLQRADAATPFYVMRFVQGPTLQERVQTFLNSDAGNRNTARFASVAFRELLQHFIDLCNIVAYAHDRGVIHRDIKPGNIILGPYGETFLMDWGLARELQPRTPSAASLASSKAPARSSTETNAASPASTGNTERQVAANHAGTSEVGDREASHADNREPKPSTPSEQAADNGRVETVKQKLDTARATSGSARAEGVDPRFTQSGQFLGTPAYAAPEQLLGQTAQTDHRADLYALGATLFFLIAGQPAVRAPGSREHLELLQQGQQPWTPFPAGTPRNLQAICRHAMALDPAARYPSALALAADVRQYLADEPVSVLPDPWSTRAFRWLRRNRSITLTIATSLVLLAVLSSLAAFWVSQLNNRLTNANSDLRNSNIALTDSQLREEKARKLAESNFDAAQAAVQQYLIGIDANEKLDQADFSDLKRELLTSAKPFLEQLRNQPTSGTAVDSSRIEAAYRLALIEQETGNFSRAIDEYDLCIALVKEARQTDANNPELIYRQIRCYCNMSSVLKRQGALDRAEQLSREAIELARQGLQAHPQELRLLETLNLSLIDLGSTLHAADDQTAAAEVLEQAIVSGTTHLTLAPDSEKAIENLASAHEQLGFVLRRTGQRALSLEQRHLAMSFRQQLAQQFPQRARYRTLLGMSYLNLGVMLAETGQPDKARENYLKGLEIHQQLALDFPSNPLHLEHAAKSLNNLGNIAPASGPGPTAADYFRQAIDIHEQLSQRFVDDRSQTVNLGGAYCNFANFQMRNDPAASIETFNRAEEILKQAEPKMPDFPQLRSNLRNVYGGRASAHGMLYQPAAAQRDWQLAADYDEGPNREFFNKQAAEAASKIADVAEFEAALTDATAEANLADQDPAKQAAFATFCTARKQHQTALRVYQRVFAAQPDLIEEFGDNGALAALAVASESASGAHADSELEQRRQWRELALGWLSQQLDSLDDPAARKQKLRQWLRHPGLLEYRTPEKQTELTEAEISAWGLFWERVTAALQ